MTLVNRWWHDVCFHLEKGEMHLRNAESQLLIEDVQLAELVRQLREDLKKIIDNYVGDTA